MSLCVLLAKVNSILLFLFILTRQLKWQLRYFLLVGSKGVTLKSYAEAIFQRYTKALQVTMSMCILRQQRQDFCFTHLGESFCTPAKYVMSCQHWVKNGHECPIHMNGFLYKSTLLSKWLSKWPEALHVSACEEAPECSSHMSKLDFTRFTPHSYHVTVAVRFHSRHVLKHTYSPFLQTFSSCDGTHF